MKNLDSLSSTPNHLSPELVDKMTSQRRSVLYAAQALLRSDTIKDEVDRRIIEKAVAFIENPTETLSDIMAHGTAVGQVLGGYMMQGIGFPPEIDAMHAYLSALQCVYLINFIEEGLLQGTNSAVIQEAFTLLNGWANTSSNSAGDNDPSFLSTVKSLAARLPVDRFIELCD